MKTYKTGILFAFVTSFCWALLAILLKYTSDFIDTGSIVFIRMLVASLSFIFFFSLTKPHYLTIFKKPPLWAVVSATFLAVNYFCYMKGIELTTVSNTQIMIQSGIVILTLVGIFYFKETLSPIQIVGIAIAHLGFGLFYGSQLEMLISEWQSHLYGNLWVLVGGVTWAVFATFQKKLSQVRPPQQLNMLTYTVSAILLASVADFSALAQLNTAQWFLLVVLGANTLIAYGCLAEALKRAPASYVSFVIALDPLITIALISLFSLYNVSFVQPEPLSWYGYIGAVLLSFGIGVALLITPRKKSVSEKNI